ncbi:MAG: hypothetical protein F6K55_19945 [Moorea sp. SIO4A3]|nr:hypothetical protein [Moorena sp. SIO4A3]
MATRSRSTCNQTTFNLQPSTKQPSTCNNLQPVTTLAFGHAIAFNLQPSTCNNLQPVTTLAFGHAIAFNLGLWPRDRVQPSTTFNPKQPHDHS